jgi:hypothetical protein
VKLFYSKGRVVTAAVVLLLALFLVRPGVSRLKVRIANSIARAVARPVEIGSVQLRFLPRPGFDLDNLVIHEDPSFGAEPMLRAREVTAVVRLTSLVRGRLDIARLELTEPSLNLVRRADGRWNLEDLLERTQRTPLAPTAKPKSEARPGFPYIEASSGRINFKSGQEKKPYALLNADFALWQESENSWGARLKAEPLRTDMNLSDTGLLRMNGVWQRAGSLRETPLQFSVEWDRAQLGQLTKLISGTDKGWRGEVRLEASLSGMPAAMMVAADTSIQNFHRYDIASSGGLKLMAHCDGRYASVEAVLHEIVCTAPVGEGLITLRGNAGLPGVHTADLLLNAENVPLSAVAQLARRAKKDLPADLLSTGNMQGRFAVKENGPASRPEFQGHGEITDLRLQSTTGKVDFTAASIPFSLSSGRTIARATSRGKPAIPSTAELLPAPDELHLEYGPFPAALGRPVPAQVRGWIARSGYGMVVRGEGEVSHTLRLASLMGLPAVKASVVGAAQMELQIAGSWAGNVTAPGFAAPAVTGTVRLHNAQATLRGVNEPVEISSAELQLLPDAVRVQKLSARVGASVWTGSAELPRACGMPSACLVRFKLNSQEVDLGGLREWLSSHPRERSWYQMLTTKEPAAPTFLQSLHASGNLTTDRLLIRSVVANRVSAAVELERGKMKISDLRADVLGGKYRGDWHADFTGSSPVYAGSGTLNAISLQQVAEAMHDPWISGTASATYQLTAAGASSATFWQSAEGVLDFDLRDGALSHISLTSEEGPLQMTRWQGRGRLLGGKIDVEKGNLVTPAGIYEITGTASLGRTLDLRLTAGAEVKPAHAGSLVYSITGTLAEPRVAVSPAAETQARLKP